MRWIVLSLLVTARTVVADTGDADALFEQGRAKLAANDFRGACALFERANELDRDAPGTLLNLGLCHEKLGELATAVRWYRKAESYAQRKSMPKVEAAARDRIVALAPKLPTLHLTLAPGAGEVVLALDRTPIDRAEYEQLAVDPGHHVISVSAPGKQPRELPIEARAGAEQAIRIEPLDAIAAAPPRSSRKTAGLWIGGIGGGLLVGQALIGFGGRLAGETNTGAWHTFTKYGLFSAGVAGGIGLVVGAAVYMTAPSEHVQPIVAPDRVGIAYTGTF